MSLEKNIWNHWSVQWRSPVSAFGTMKKTGVLIYPLCVPKYTVKDWSNLLGSILWIFLSRVDVESRIWSCVRKVFLFHKIPPSHNLFCKGSYQTENLLRGHLLWKELYQKENLADQAFFVIKYSIPNGKAHIHKYICKCVIKMFATMDR